MDFPDSRAAPPHIDTARKILLCQPLGVGAGSCLRILPAGPGCGGWAWVICGWKRPIEVELRKTLVTDWSRTLSVFGTYHRVQVSLSMTIFLVIVCNRSLTEDVCRTMDHETGAKGRAAPG